MSEEEITVSAAGVSRRVIPPSEDRSDAEVTASGAELDRMVAEIVMGYRWVAFDRGARLLRPDMRQDAYPDEIGFFRGGARPDLYFVPEFCERPEWALTVIDKLREHGHWCEMRSPWTADDGARWWAGFTPHGTTGWNGRPDHWHSGATLAEAVCRAAVAAMMEQRAYEESERAETARDADRAVMG